MAVYHDIHTISSLKVVYPLASVERVPLYSRGQPTNFSHQLAATEIRKVLSCCTCMLYMQQYRVAVVSFQNERSPIPQGCLSNFLSGLVSPGFPPANWRLQPFFLFLFQKAEPISRTSKKGRVSCFLSSLSLDKFSFLPNLTGERNQGEGFLLPKTSIWRKKTFKKAPLFYAKGKEYHHGFFLSNRTVHSQKQWQISIWGWESAPCQKVLSFLLSFSALQREKGRKGRETIPITRSLQEQNDIGILCKIHNKPIEIKKLEKQLYFFRYFSTLRPSIFSYEKKNTSPIQRPPAAYKEKGKGREKGRGSGDRGRWKLASQDAPNIVDKKVLGKHSRVFSSSFRIFYVKERGAAHFAVFKVGTTKCAGKYVLWLEYESSSKDSPPPLFETFYHKVLQAKEALKR